MSTKEAGHVTHLVALTDIIKHFVIADLIHISKLLQPIGCLDPNEGLGERDRTEPPIKEEQALVGVDVQEPSDVEIVWESGGQSNYPYHGLARLHLSQSPCNKALDDCSSVLMEEMYLINDQEADNLG